MIMKNYAASYEKAISPLPNYGTWPEVYLFHQLLHIFVSLVTCSNCICLVHLIVFAAFYQCVMPSPIQASKKAIKKQKEGL